MDPQVMIAQQSPSPKESVGFKKYLKPLGIFLGVLIISYLSFTRLPQLNRKLPPILRRQPTLQIGATTKLNVLIKKTFSASDGYKDIIDYTNLASNEKDPGKGYYYYRKLYFKILQAYQATRNPNFALVLQKVKEYCKVYPSFKDTDFPNPISNV